MNKRVQKVSIFGACKEECEKGEPVLLVDGRYLQANRCPNGNICALVGSSALNPSELTQMNPIIGSDPTAGAVYTVGELEVVGDGSAKIGMMNVVRAIISDPSQFVIETEKPMSQDPEFYAGHIDNRFE